MVTKNGSVPCYCAYCATGNHRACRRPDCACARRAHDPDVEMAAAMRKYVRPDLVKLPVETLATQYRKATAS